MSSTTQEKVKETLQEELDEEPSQLFAEAQDGLPDFEGREVRGSQLRLVKAGDGLSEALALQPRAYHADDEIHLVVRATVTQINHKTEKDSEELIRVHTASVTEATEVSAKDAETFLAIARDRLQKARDSKTGQTSLLDGEGEDDDDAPNPNALASGFDPSDLPKADGTTGEVIDDEPEGALD